MRAAKFCLPASKSLNLPALLFSSSVLLKKHSLIMAPTKTGIRYGLNSGRVVTAIPKSVKPSQRKGIQSHKTQVVRSVIREVSTRAHLLEGLVRMGGRRRVCTLRRGGNFDHTSGWGREGREPTEG